MESIIDFRKFIQRVQLTPKKMAEMNSLIFYNWNERDGKKYFPENIVRFISGIQTNDSMLNELFDCLRGAVSGKEHQEIS